MVQNEYTSFHMKNIKKKLLCQGRLTCENFKKDVLQVKKTGYSWKTGEISNLLILVIA